MADGAEFVDEQLLGKSRATSRKSHVDKEKSSKDVVSGAEPLNEGDSSDDDTSPSQNEEAAEALDAAKVEPDADRSLELKEQGNEKFKEGEVEEALRLYEEALEYSPEDESFAKNRSVFYGNAAACLLRLKRFEECIVACDSSLDIDEKYTKVALRRAAALEGLEKYMEAVEDYEEILEREPANLVAKQGLERSKKKQTEQEEKMKEEMFSKMKQVGDSVLGWFGLSTDNFKVEQDPKTGGYSVNFQQNPDGGGEQKKE